MGDPLVAGQEQEDGPAWWRTGPVVTWRRAQMVLPALLTLDGATTPATKSKAT
jgi:hypothetical protein